MENLKELNLVELNAQETATTEGGFWGELVKIVAGAVVGALISQDWDKVSEAYNAGYNSWNHP